MIDLDSARAFMATHARLLDRRRLDLLLGEAPPDGVLAALVAHRNPDGGFGWGLEPDLRAPSSQPVGALHALELLEEVAPATVPLAVELCDWLASATLPDGGLPFACAGAAGPGSAPWWAGADPARSSLHITAAVCASARRVALHDGDVAAHPWLERATEYCWRELTALEEPGGSYELRYVLQLLDALVGSVPAAERELERLARFVPASGELPVAGGAAGEALRALDFAPLPDRPLRRVIAREAVDRELDRLQAGQGEDGGWTVGFSPGSPAAALEWRGHATVGAIALLVANGRLSLPHGRSRLP